LDNQVEKSRLNLAGMLREQRDPLPSAPAFTHVETMSLHGADHRWLLVAEYSGSD
jgi:hypothetical protein